MKALKIVAVIPAQAGIHLDLAQCMQEQAGFRLYSRHPWRSTFGPASPFARRSRRAQSPE
jgi:hypothetical protein